jgi:hypothetical protein
MCLFKRKIKINKFDHITIARNLKPEDVVFIKLARSRYTSKQLIDIRSTLEKVLTCKVVLLPILD